MRMSRRFAKRFITFFLRGIILLGGILLAIFDPDAFSPLEGMNFFSGFTLLHLFWGYLMVETIFSLIPRKANPLSGWEKLSPKATLPALKSTPRPTEQIRKANRGALRVAALWCSLSVLVGVLHLVGIFTPMFLFLLTLVLLVLDRMCVLFWCPFQRFLMRNRCCKSCRILCWDRLMIVSPLYFLGGFFSLSLILPALIRMVWWEITFLRHPQRFFPETSSVLRCGGCIDRLCLIKSPFAKHPRFATSKLPEGGGSFEDSSF
ncbi:MAG: hypothetical protein IJY82_05795 [Oscillospiraceae bacterium]|nr:hypothetical protein [Oscillospiraceae bacterium]